MRIFPPTCGLFRMRVVLSRVRFKIGCAADGRSATAVSYGRLLTA
jgi:hypothetical protein